MGVISKQPRDDVREERRVEVYVIRGEALEEGEPDCHQGGRRIVQAFRRHTFSRKRKECINQSAGRPELFFCFSHHGEGGGGEGGKEDGLARDGD